MAEQFGFEQVFRNGSAIHGHEAAVTPHAVEMEHSGDEFLSGSAFSLNQHRTLAIRHLFDEIEHLAHLGAGTDQMLKSVLITDGFPK